MRLVSLLLSGIPAAQFVAVVRSRRVTAGPQVEVFVVGTVAVRITWGSPSSARGLIVEAVQNKQSIVHLWRDDSHPERGPNSRSGTTSTGPFARRSREATPVRPFMSRGRRRPEV